MIARLLFAAVLLLAQSASAIGGWYPTTSESGSTLSAIGGTPSSGRRLAYFLFDSADATGFSPVLGTLGCGPADLTFHRDTSGTGTALIRVWTTTSAAGSAAPSASTGLTQLCPEINGDGVEDCDPIDGTTANHKHMSDWTAQGIVVEVTTAATSGDTPAAEVRCRY